MRDGDLCFDYLGILRRRKSFYGEHLVPLVPMNVSRIINLSSHQRLRELEVALSDS